jgi:hypothetical protein
MAATAAAAAHQRGTAAEITRQLQPMFNFSYFSAHLR